MILRFLFIGTLLSSAAMANVIEPSEESFSRALQQAKRVASLENDQNIPAPVVKLSQRVAKNSRKLAFQAKKLPPKAKKAN